MMLRLSLLFLVLASVALPQNATVTTQLPQGRHVCFVRVPADLQAKIQCMQIPQAGVVALSDKVQTEKAEDGVTPLWRGPAHVIFQSTRDLIKGVILAYPPQSVKDAKAAQLAADTALRNAAASASDSAAPAVPGTEP
jgi:hypothetical protein